MIAQLLGDHPGEAVAIHRQSAAGGDAGGVGTADDQAVQTAQLLLEKAHRVLQLVGTQGVGAAQLCKIFGFMGGSGLVGLHLAQGHMDTPLRQLPCSLAAGQTRADYSYIHFVSSALAFFVVFFAAGFFSAVFFAAVFLVAVFLAAVFFSVDFSSAFSSPPSVFFLG